MNKNTRTYKTVVIEGNIGSGKTTFLNHLVKACQQELWIPEICPEPLDKWRNLRGENLFAQNNAGKGSFAFQSYVQLTMLEAHKTVPVNPLVNLKLMERTIHSARYCFVENLFSSGKLTLSEYHVIDEWYRYIIQNENMSIDLVLYLKTRPETAYARVLQRDREEEQNLSLDYLKDIHRLHENWLIQPNQYPTPAQVLVIDYDIELDKLSRLCETLTGIQLNQILNSQ